MSTTLNETRISRPLYAWEEAQARLVFAGALDYKKVRIQEFYNWPDQIDEIGRKLKKIAPRPQEAHNAITLFNGCYFPVGLPIDQPPFEDVNFFKLPWLIHELTHCWQFQKIGMKYIFLALSAQFKEGENVYNIGESKNLNEKRQQGWEITNFNLEQQAQISSKFYNALACNPKDEEMYAACLPYIMDIQGTV